MSDHLIDVGGVQFNIGVNEFVARIASQPVRFTLFPLFNGIALDKGIGGRLPANLHLVAGIIGFEGFQWCQREPFGAELERNLGNATRCGNIHRPHLAYVLPLNGWLLTGIVLGSTERQHDVGRQFSDRLRPGEGHLGIRFIRKDDKLPRPRFTDLHWGLIVGVVPAGGPTPIVVVKVDRHGLSKRRQFTGVQRIAPHQRFRLRPQYRRDIRRKRGTEQQFQVKLAGGIERGKLGSGDRRRGKR